MDTPRWDPASKSDSLREWAKHLIAESRQVFLKDKTHVQVIFVFKDEGLVSVAPVPAKVAQDQVHEAIRQAVREHNLYGVIHVGEGWMYLSKHAKDHTMFQLLDGEMRVADLRPEDRQECLFLRVENRDGDVAAFVSRIVRDEDDVGLDAGFRVEDKRRWFEG